MNRWVEDKRNQKKKKEEEGRKKINNKIKKKTHQRIKSRDSDKNLTNLFKITAKCNLTKTRKFIP
jgi:hypothetical protein